MIGSLGKLREQRGGGPDHAQKGRDAVRASLERIAMARAD